MAAEAADMVGSDSGFQAGQQWGGEGGGGQGGGETPSPAKGLGGGGKGGKSPHSCRDHHQRGMCQRGEACRFTH